MAIESWKDIDGYEGLYQISNLGMVRSFSKGDSVKYKKPQNRSDGYYQVRLYQNWKGQNKKIHRLVALAFIENPNGYKCVNHIDGDKQNNSVENLEWCDHSYNNLHACQTGLRKKYLGGDNWEAKQVVQKNLEGEVVKTWGSIREAARALKISESSISSCINGRSKKGTGFIWEQVNAEDYNKRMGHRKVNQYA